MTHSVRFSIGEWKRSFMEHQPLTSAGNQQNYWEDHRLLLCSAACGSDVVGQRAATLHSPLMEMWDVVGISLTHDFMMIMIFFFFPSCFCGICILFPLINLVIIDDDLVPVFAD